jgi:hypothetical protein
MEEGQIIQSAIQNFILHTGLKMNECKILHHKSAKILKGDACIEVVDNENIYKFWVLIKNELRQIHLPNLIQQLTSDRENRLLICQYISKSNRKQLKDEGINYIDASGNCFIRNGNLLIFINDKQVAPQRKSNTGKLWKPAGLRLIFSLLLNPKLINESYRVIANESNLSLGTIGELLQELEKEKYFNRYSDKLILENREALLNTWMETYHAILRPKLVRGRFRFATQKDRENWKNIKLNEVWWGGEPAGAILTRYLHPEKFTIYSNLPNTEVMKQLHIVPAPDGDIELLKIFWNTQINLQTQYPDIVPPLLAFAELNTSMDSRNRETASKIKSQYHV